MIRRLAHVCLAATDLAATERFYCEGLGFRKVFDFLRDDRPVGFYLEVSEGSYVEVFLESEAPDPDGVIRHLCFEADDMDRTREHLLALGIKVDEKRLGADQSWQCWTADPAGVKIEFHQYTPESSQRTGHPCVL